ncbi:pectate lyase [Caulobacter segnis]|uniref:pectate lyase n=1 Tax=Caulobacter segnis TaxID=88688 RepID=UPI00241095DB|nr:pectate lyase [Caulobacter segnis]MDG2522223.1 pectate lyase [Caulobacter segnis]
MNNSMSRRGLLAMGAALAAFTPVMAQSAVPTRAQTLATMKRATQFMVETVAYKGGYVWSYLPDFSRRFGEMEAFPTMMWVQPPGTATAGHLFLDAYHATGDEYYYTAAQSAASALIAAQHPAGGWNYLYDFAGEDSIKRWYDTIGKNGWRLEEFQHYYGNATFDDAGTAEASQFMLRIYLEKKDKQYWAPLQKAISFVLDSQYPVGGWPQRYPLTKDGGLHGNADYTGYITFNDDVAGENLEFLLMVYQTLGDQRVVDPINRAMNSFVVTQQPQPQPGWGLQHTVEDLKPAGARTYEPKAFATHTTAQNVTSMMGFYRLTGDPKFLARIPEALDWLDQVKLPPELAKDGRTHPTFIEIGTGKALFIHRSGSNVVNGRYYADYNPDKTVIHYGSTRAVNVSKLRAEYEALKAASPAEVSKNSPLKAKPGSIGLPKYFTGDDVSVSDLNVNALHVADGVKPEDAQKLIAGLNKAGWWPTELKAASNPYAGDGSPTPAPGDYSQTRVGDKTDTSPYVAENPPIGISTGAYIDNMGMLIRYLDSLPKT